MLTTTMAASKTLSPFPRSPVLPLLGRLRFGVEVVRKGIAAQKKITNENDVNSSMMDTLFTTRTTSRMVVLSRYVFSKNQYARAAHDKNKKGEKSTAGLKPDILFNRTW
mmetsp:Transcript_28568/g.72792  ORF Transcript_28568/g.72792 Transcript_28568/m.72792 type:complete len:109 (-) Transcript_28568:889-1215(-)